MIYNQNLKNNEIDFDLKNSNSIDKIVVYFIK